MPVAPLPVAVTMGEPGGIAGEILIKAWQQGRDQSSRCFVVVADPDWIEATAQSIDPSVAVTRVETAGEAATVFGSALPVLDVGHRVEVELGKAEARNAPAVIASIAQATGLCRSENAAAVVTIPIQKQSLYKAGFTFPGHTEYIADLCGVIAPVMMLASPLLRVVPVTVHQSLSDAVTSLSTDKIFDTVMITDQAMREDFGIASPRIAVSGLNPHAGEGGALGREEETIIQPALKRLAAAGVSVRGPVPGDALFTPRARETYDAAVCMYHDQALIPIKAIDFDRAVNTTLGLPIVRTSPDHGTALDIAGKGLANPTSLIAAIDMARAIATSRQQLPVDV